MAALQEIKRLQEAMQASIIGQEKLVERILLVMLSNGNILLESLPGLAKTRAVKSLAKHLQADFSRIQFTPDLLPADISGSEIYLGENSQERFEFQPGPVFANLVLADEVNRAPAKVQAALLEAMEERQVTVAGQTHPLPSLFMVLATQNPVEQEGTYPLPEAQMDRFLMHVTIDYPSDDHEVEVMRLVRGEEFASMEELASTQAHSPTQVASPEQTIDQIKLEQGTVFSARKEIHAVVIPEPVEKYIAALVGATRRPQAIDDELGRFIQVGASPRGSLALDKAARAHAWLSARDQVTPDDVLAVIHDCLRHRLMLTFEASAEGVTRDEVIDRLIKVVALA